MKFQIASTVVASTSRSSVPATTATTAPPVNNRSAEKAATRKMQVILLTFTDNYVMPQRILCVSCLRLKITMSCLRLQITILMFNRYVISENVIVRFM